MDAAGGVGDDEGVAPQQPEHPDRVCRLLVGIALIVVHPALHHGHRPARQCTEHQPALVARSGRGFEMGNITVGHSDGVFHHVAQKPQAGTQHQGYLWDETAQTERMVSALA